MSEPERKVHPAAAVFPMLSDDELADLGEDIKANGLVHAIVVDKDGQIVDGRNRDEACRRAGVEPRYETLNGHDPVAFILSANVHRRHMSTGQRAMAVARVRLFATNKQRQQDVADAADVSQPSVAKANVVLRHAPDLAELVLSGGMFLDDAYAKARARKVEQETEAEADARALAETTVKAARLQAAAPDLADLVAEWRMSLDEAMSVLEKREHEEQERRERDTAGFARATSYLAALLGQEPVRIARDWLPKANTYASIAGCETLWTADGLRDLARRLGEAADAWRE